MMAHLKYWIQKNRDSAGPEIDIVAAQDDMLNASTYREWAIFPLTPESRHLLLFEHGGHFGFMNAPWFVEVLKDHFHI